MTFGRYYGGGKSHEDSKDAANAIASMLKFIAWITYLCGFITGLIFGRIEMPYGAITGLQTQFSFSIALIFWFAAFISGTLFLAFAEVINLLQKIVNQNNATKQ